MAKRIKTGNRMNQITGFGELEDLLKSLADQSIEVYEKELEKVASVIENNTKSNITDGPTGNLKSSVTLKKASGKKRVSYKISAGGAKAPHAHLVEFGHRIITKNGDVVGDVPAHPFLRKAFEENKSNIETALNNALNELLKEV